MFPIFLFGKPCVIFHFKSKRQGAPVDSVLCFYWATQYSDKISAIKYLFPSQIPFNKYSISNHNVSIFRVDFIRTSNSYYYRIFWRFFGDLLLLLCDEGLDALQLGRVHVRPQPTLLDDQSLQRVRRELRFVELDESETFDDLEMTKNVRD